MYCRKCGAQQADGARYCTNCGFNLFDTGPGAAAAAYIQYAGFWRRFAANIIDGIIMNIVSLGLGAALGMGVFESFISYSSMKPVVDYTQFFIFYGVTFAADVLFFGLFESSGLQATPGKLVLGIKVTDINGNRISFGRAVGRYFGKIVSGLILGIGYLMIAFTEKKQGLHDMMAGTLVVLK